MITLDALDLSALLCSRVCHDVISPVGAIVNGLEIIDDSADAETQAFALDMIRKSADKASAKLKFARLAFGASGSAGAAIDLADAESAARAMFADEKVALDWTAPRALVPKDRVKLLLNLVVLAATAIPRGGSLDVSVQAEDPEQSEFTITARGTHSRIPAHAEDLLAGRSEGGSVDAHAIQPFYTGMLARATGLAVAFFHEGDTVTLRATRSSNAKS